MTKQVIDKILCVGCSHASSVYTKKSWPYWISNHYNQEVDVLCSSGAGIQIGVDKLCVALDKNIYNAVIFQIPSNTRLSVGMNTEYLITSHETETPWEINGNKVKEEWIMSLNAQNNVNAMTKFWGPRFKKLFKGFNAWYLQFVADNLYETEVRLFHNLYLAQSLCERNNIPFYAFFWHPQITRDDSRVLLASWQNLINWSNTMPNSITDFLKDNNMVDSIHPLSPVLDAWAVDGYHLNSLGSKRIVDEYIVPNIEKIDEFNKRKI